MGMRPPITALAILSSTTMYGTQRPDAEATKVPHSGHVISVLCSTFITDSSATDGLISLRGQSERWDHDVGSKENSLCGIATTITGLPPATLISDSARTATPVYCYAVIPSRVRTMLKTSATIARQILSGPSSLHSSIRGLLQASCDRRNDI